MNAVIPTIISFIVLVVGMVYIRYSENTMKKLRGKIDDIQTRLGKIETERFESPDLSMRFLELRSNFLKILTPIRQNAEDIDQLDDDLKRLEDSLYELKKRED